MSKSRIDRLLEAQARELETLTDREAANVLRALEDARRDLRERLEAMRQSGADQVTRFTAQHLRVQLAQVEAAVRQLTERMNGALADAERKAHELALKNLLSTIKAHEPDFVDTGGRIELAALRRLTEERGLLLHQHSVERYGSQLVENIQREITRGVAGGQTLDQIVERIVATDQSVFAGMRHRAELIARMELNRAYNAGHQAALEEAAAILDEPGTDDPLLKKADEFTDKRNHPFSRALDGKTAPVTGEWEVPDSEVQAAAALLGRRATGIVWRHEGAVWKGGNYPAHYNDRGRQVPWRKSWGDDGRDAFRGHDDRPAPLPMGPMEKSSQLGETAKLADLVANPLHAGSEGVLLNDVDPRGWFEGNRFNPDAIPHEVRRATWLYAQRLQVEAALVYENGKVRLISGARDAVEVPLGQAGVHPVAHTHSRDPLPSDRDRVMLVRHVDRLTARGEAVTAQDLPSVVLYGEGPDDYTPFYGNV